MIRTALVVSIALSTLFLAACGGGSSRRSTDFGNADRCSDSNPLPFEVTENGQNQKVNWDALPEGNYEYTGIEYYVIDIASDFRIHAKDAKGPKGDFVGGVACLRNARSGLTFQTALNLPAITKVEASGKTIYENRGLVISYGDKTSVTASSLPGSESEAPSKVADDQNLQSQVYQKNSADGALESFEVRVKSEDANFKKYGIIRFKKIP